MDGPSQLLTIETMINKEGPGIGEGTYNSVVFFSVFATLWVGSTSVVRRIEALPFVFSPLEHDGISVKLEHFGLPTAR